MLRLKWYIVCVIFLFSNMNDEDNFDDFEDMDDTLFDGMSELERIEAEQALLDEAINNSYNIITEKITFEQLMIDKGGYSGIVTTLAHDIENGPSKEEINTLIEYFEKREEYEKCAKLHKILTA